MPESCAGHAGHPVPRAHLDAITDPDTALALVASAASRPPSAETIVVLLGHDRTGSCIVIVDGTDPPDREVDAVEAIAGAVEHARVEHAGVEHARHHVTAMIVASVRPGGGVVLGDADRWLEMSSVAEHHGLVLVEWFVCGHEVDCPRDLLAEPPRW